MPGSLALGGELVDDGFAVLLYVRVVGDHLVDADFVTDQDREEADFVDFSVVHHEEADAGVGGFGCVAGVGVVGAVVDERCDAGGEA